MYRMYIDETGNADFAVTANPDHRFLSLTGIIIEHGAIKALAIPELQRIKAEILGFDPDSRIPLHRNEIVKKQYPFHVLRSADKEREFNAAILALFKNLEFTVITAVIDKDAHLKLYKKWARDPYHYCLQVLFERYCLMLNRCKGRGDVMTEARGKNEDERLRAAYAQLYDYPAPIRRDVVDKCITSRKLKIEKKVENIAGLQIADLIAHPSALLARAWFNGERRPEGFAKEIIQTLRQNRKYQGKWTWRGYRIEGYGMKWLP
jgi:hypothetical protein